MNFAETDLARLASFPEQNPNPVVEISLEGTITYSNPAAAKIFPDLQSQGLTHPLFEKVREYVLVGKKKEINNLTCEVFVHGRIFEQKLFYIESGNLVRVYSSDITKQKENEKKLANLALFPEQNPNPVIELSRAGTITYQNPAARKMFPDLESRGIHHPLFAKAKEQLLKEKKDQINNFSCEVRVNDQVFEQKLYYIPADDLVRVYSSDITLQKETEKQLANLALFPEQNPNLVIEVSSSSGKVTYLNPAARKRFPDLDKRGLAHPLLRGVNMSEKKDFQREIQLEGSDFEQKIYFIQDSELIRVYSHDITEQKKTQRSLSRLASFPELNPSPIVEIDLNRNITYINPACRNRFPSLAEQKLDHPALKPFVERFEELRSGKITHYVDEIKIDSHFYSQRARYMPEHGVVRIFNNDITEQKKNEEIIREKNKDITDSINYARKIQTSILPSEEFVHKGITDYFILYKPKDIISGDFYWFTSIGEHFLFACADCTGHGVPGALMSMVGSNYISHIVNESEIKSPDAALLELDKRVRKSLKQDDEPENRDGMDIAFCSLHVEKRLLHYAGANRPIAIIRKGELTEYDPSKFPIGGQSGIEKKFEANTIQLEKGDCLYLFSDGITDQFGGPRGKKLMKKNFYELLKQVCPLPMDEQKKRLLTYFEEWKGDLEQTDDVLVMGIRML